jgi:hypothetical protein
LIAKLDGTLFADAEPLADLFECEAFVSPLEHLCFAWRASSSLVRVLAGVVAGMSWGGGCVLGLVFCDVPGGGA